MTFTNKRIMLLLALLGSAIAGFTITTAMVLGQMEPHTSLGEVIVLDTLEAADRQLSWCPPVN